MIRPQPQTVGRSHQSIDRKPPRFDDDLVLYDAAAISVGGLSGSWIAFSGAAAIIVLLALGSTLDEGDNQQNCAATIGIRPDDSIPINRRLRRRRDGTPHRGCKPVAQCWHWEYRKQLKSGLP